MGPPAYSEMHPSIFSLDFVYSDIEGLPVPGVRQVWLVGGVSGFGGGVATWDPSSHQGETSWTLQCHRQKRAFLPFGNALSLPDHSSTIREAKSTYTRDHERSLILRTWPHSTLGSRGWTRQPMSSSKAAQAKPREGRWPLATVH